MVGTILYIVIGILVSLAFLIFFPEDEDDGLGRPFFFFMTILAWPAFVGGAIVVGGLVYIWKGADWLANTLRERFME